MVDLYGKKFGRLTIIEPTEKRCGGFIVWKCQCDCGKIAYVSSGNLCSGNTKSCGCLRKEQLPELRITHGMSNSSIYCCWRNMLQRCENPNHVGYKNYGGRGIKVCERWHTFENFLKDMEECPKGLTIERKNNDGNYNSKNCIWATPKKQANNRRPISHGLTKQKCFFARHKLGFFRISNSLRAFAKEFGLNHENISACLRNKQRTCKGWTFTYY